MAMRKEEVGQGPTGFGGGGGGGGPLGGGARPNELNALLGKGSSFEGKLLFEGSVRIDGKFTGEIVSTDTLIIGEGADVKGEIQVGSLVVVGDYNGNAKASKGVELRAPAKVRGTLVTASIVIERGVFFDGTCKMDSSGGATAGGTPTRTTPVSEALPGGPGRPPERKP
jgi:cytoskeletal protein CcmA (bactofilin family)